MSAEQARVAGFSYLSASVEIAAAEPAWLDGIRFLYQAFDAPSSPARWRYDVNREGSRVRVSLGDEWSHVAGDETDALNTLDWCVSSHLLGDLDPWPVVLHAAGLHSPAGGTVLLVAPSGGGKSTLAAAMLARGATLLSDELVPIDARDLRPLAYPRAMALKNDAAVPPEVVHREYRTRTPLGSVRWLQAARAWPPGRAADPVRAVVFCEYDPAGPTRLSPMARPQVLARLLAQAPMLADDRETGFATLAGLSDRVPAFRLLHADAAEAAARLLALPSIDARREAS